MERKKRSKGSVWEFCYANKIFGTFGFEMRECGQKFVKFCTLTHIHTTAAKLVVRITRVIDEIILLQKNSARTDQGINQKKIVLLRFGMIMLLYGCQIVTSWPLFRGQFYGIKLHDVFLIMADSCGYYFGRMGP